MLLKKHLMYTRPLLPVFHLQKSCLFFSFSSVVEMATELFHWQLYEMHFSGRNISTSNQTSVQLVNPLSPRWYGNDFKNAITEYILRIKCMSMLDEIALHWMPHKTFDEKSTLVQITAWWRKATSHYLSQCWPRSMLPCGTNYLVYSSGYVSRGRSRMQVKIVADSLLFVKLHLLTR